MKNFLRKNKLNTHVFPQGTISLSYMEGVGRRPDKTRLILTVSGESYLLETKCMKTRGFKPFEIEVTKRVEGTAPDWVRV